MANAEGSDIMLNRVMTKDNIALAALLEIKDSAWEPNPDPRVSGTPLLVATAHIHWDPEFSDVKLIQTMMLVDQVSDIGDAEFIFTCGGARRSTSGTGKSGHKGKEGPTSSQMGKEGT